MQLVLKNAALAHANMAALSSLIASSMFMTALSFYFIFGEKLNARHYIGMAIMLLSAILIS
jgi:drug/metabolite transporter (DMT)-like permease